MNDKTHILYKIINNVLVDKIYSNKYFSPFIHRHKKKTFRQGWVIEYSNPQL